MSTSMGDVILTVPIFHKARVTVPWMLFQLAEQISAQGGETMVMDVTGKNGSKLSLNIWRFMEDGDEKLTIEVSDQEQQNKEGFVDTGQDGWKLDLNMIQSPVYIQKTKPNNNTDTHREIGDTKSSTQTYQAIGELDRSCDYNLQDVVTIKPEPEDDESSSDVYDDASTDNFRIEVVGLNEDYQRPTGHINISYSDASTGNIKSLEELLETVQDCTCCKGSKVHCPLCPTTIFKPAKKSKVMSHLEATHWCHAITNALTGITTVPCRNLHPGVVEKRHHHCPTCGDVILTKRNMINHIAKSCRGRKILHDHQYTASPPVKPKEPTVVNKISKEVKKPREGEPHDVPYNSDINADIETAETEKKSRRKIPFANYVPEILDPEARPYNFKSLEELNLTVQQCTCCPGNKFHCPLCPTNKYKPALKYKVLSHQALHHWSGGIKDSKTGMTTVPCSNLHPGVDKLHFHCPKCPRLMHSKRNLIRHMERGCMTTFKRKSRDPCTIPRPAGPPKKIQLSTPKRQICIKCDKSISSKYMKRHVLSHDHTVPKDINVHRHHHTVLVDAADGLYCSSTLLHGAWNPIHLRKVTSGPIAGTFCEVKTCTQAMNEARSTGNLAFECPHAKSTAYCIPGVPFVGDTMILVNMCSIGLIDNDIATQLQNHAASTTSPLVVYLPNREFGSERYWYFSIYTGKRHKWCLHGRTIVSFDSKTKTLGCKCSEKVTCLHREAVRWYLFQERPAVLSGGDIDVESEESEVEDTSNEVILEIPMDYTEVPTLQEGIQTIPTSQEGIQSTTIFQWKFDH